MDKDYTLSANSVSKKLATSFEHVDQLSRYDRRELLSLLNTSYPNWGLDKIFESYNDEAQLYIFRIWFKNSLIASRQIMITDTKKNMPQWSLGIANALYIQRFAIGSRAIVHPDFRKNGLGKELVLQVNHEAFAKHRVEAILGSSTNITAIKLYQRMGAKLWTEDINTFNFYNSNTFNNTLYNKPSSCKQKLTRMPKPLRYIYHQHNLIESKESNLYLSHIQNTPARQNLT